MYQIFYFTVFSIFLLLVAAVLGGCTVHLGYTPKLYLSQTDRFENQQEVDSTASLDTDVVVPESSRTPTVQKENVTCVIPPKPKKPFLPKPVALTHPDVRNLEQVNAVLAEHILVLEEFIISERTREREYHRELQKACNP